MRIPDQLTYLLRNLYSGQWATVRIGHGTMEYSSAIKNEILVHAYNMDELWIAKWKKPVTKYHIIWFHLYAVSRTD